MYKRQLDEMLKKLFNSPDTLAQIRCLPLRDGYKLATEKLRPYWDEWAKAHGPEAIEVLGKIRAAVGR